MGSEESEPMTKQGLLSGISKTNKNSGYGNDNESDSESGRNGEL